MFITANRSRRATFRLVTDALFAALFVVLAAYLTVKLPVMEISLSTLPLLLAGFLFGPIDAVTVALIGSFLEQALSQYGLTPSAPLWMLPPILLALVAGLLGLAARRLPQDSRRYLTLLVTSTVLAEFLCTAANTAVLYIDGLYVAHYHVKALTALLPLRLANLGLRLLVTCLAVPLLVPRLQKLMSKRNLS